MNQISENLCRSKISKKDIQLKEKEIFNVLNFQINEAQMDELLLVVLHQLVQFTQIEISNHTFLFNNLCLFLLKIAIFFYSFINKKKINYIVSTVIFSAKTIFKTIFNFEIEIFEYVKKKKLTLYLN